jgi:hypothetical protein
MPEWKETRPAKGIVHNALVSPLPGRAIHYQVAVHVTYEDGTKDYIKVICERESYLLALVSALQSLPEAGGTVGEIVVQEFNPN